MELPSLWAGSRRRVFALLVANGVGQAVAATLAAVLVRHAFDELVSASGGVGLGALYLQCASLLATVVTIAALRWRATLDAERLGQSYVHAIRVQLFRHLLRIGADGARRVSRGALSLRFVGDLSAIRNWVSLGLASLTVSGLASFAALLALAFIQPLIAASVAIATLFATLLVAAAGKQLRQRNQVARRQRGRIAALINDRLSALSVIEAFGQQQRETRRLRRASRRVRDALVARAVIIGLLRALAEASSGLASMFALLVGATLVASSEATPGDVVAAMVVAGLLAPRLRELARAYEYWNAASVAREKLLEILTLRRPDKRARQRGPHVPIAATCRISLHQVARRPAFSAVDLDIEPGQRVAIVGANGAGKSTLLRLLAGINTPDYGKVTIDGVDLRQIRRQTRRKIFTMVAPDLPLLRGSLRLNLTYGSPAADVATVRQAVDACQLSALVASLPNGLDTRLSDAGGALSTGEKARIAMARALLVQPRVLLLDEDDANLDAATREAMEQLLSRFKGTVVFATHDLYRAARADKVVEISDGQVATISESRIRALAARQHRLMNVDQPLLLPCS